MRNLLSRFSIVSAVFISALSVLSSCEKESSEADGLALQRVDSFFGKPCQMTKSQLEMNDEVNSFTFDLFNRLREDGKDIFISPLSLSLALSMLTTGAGGRTEAELLKALGFEDRTKEELDGYFSLVSSRFSTADPSVVATSANALWPDESLKLNDGFVSDCSRYFDADVISVDYSDEEGTMDRMNAWSSEHTNGRIPMMVTEPLGGPMALTNAVYLNAKWSFDFEESEGRLMARLRTLYAENKDMEVVWLPYGGGIYALAVIKSKKRSGQLAITKASWDDLVSKTHTADVSVVIPSFRNEWERDLVETFKAMGVHDAFTPFADFSSMSPTSLLVSTISHKTFINVDQKGTEAAAVTVIGMTFGAAGPIKEPEYPQVRFTADGDFTYLIADRVTGTILFIGQHSAQAR